MSLNSQKGNMYPWVTHTWNPIKGKCPFQCTYCYMKRRKVGELRLDDKALQDNLGEGRTIFIGSSLDMFAQAVPGCWIRAVLHRIQQFPQNTYFFQSKFPQRFHRFRFPENTKLGTTIETNRDYNLTLAPSPAERACAMYSLFWPSPHPKIISIEPIMDFDLNAFVAWIHCIEPEFVSIGADSKGHNLPEPPGLKLTALIAELQQFTEVKQKSNLQRLLT